MQGPKLEAKRSKHLEMCVQFVPDSQSRLLQVVRTLGQLPILQECAGREGGGGFQSRSQIYPMASPDLDSIGP